MELKTISEIKSLSPEGRTDYAYHLSLEIEESLPTISGLLDDIVATPEEYLPVNTAVFKEVCLYLVDVFADESTDAEDYHECTLQVSEEPLCRLNWCEAQVQHAVFLSLEQYRELTSFKDTCFNEGITSAIGQLRNALGESSLTEADIAYLVSLAIREDCTIPTNSGSLAIKEDTSRFSGAMWYEAIRQKVITLAGVGGIGSYVGFLLARMKPTSMFIYDDDKVEAANMSGQLYSKEDIGNYKVDALAKMVGNYADFNSIFAVSQRFTEECEASDIMICGFDNMAARTLFFEKWKEFVMNKPPEDRIHCLFIDGRLAAEELQVYCITGDSTYNMVRYASSLFTDEEADETVCSYKQTTYMANMIGSIIVNLFTNFVANEMLGFLGRELPYFVSYSGLSMKLEIE